MSGPVTPTTATAGITSGARGQGPRTPRMLGLTASPLPKLPALTSNGGLGLGMSKLPAEEEPGSAHTPAPGAGVLPLLDGTADGHEKPRG